MDDYCRNKLMSRLQTERQAIATARATTQARIDALKQEITALEAQVTDHNTREAEAVALQTALQTA